MPTVKEALNNQETRGTRTVAGVVNGIETFEGAGFLVRRPFPQASFSEFDPFLLLDEMGPMELGPGQAKGAPDHPHRGFETVTYMLSGELEHKDSGGRAGRLSPGDVQWMTAGAGVVHSEMPSAQIPKATSSDGLVTVSVIAGEALGQKAVIETRTPIIYLHCRIKPGGSVVQQMPRAYSGFAYVIDGEGTFGAEREHAGDGQMVLFAQDGDEVRIENLADAKTTLEVLLIAGLPLNEPVARYGPFVMNTREEIYQAIEDYRLGRMGVIG